MAFCGIVGILILLNVGSRVLFGGLHSLVFGAPGSAIGMGVATLIGIFLLAVALRLRRHLKALDAIVETDAEE
jgi:hypothetical protein